MEEKEVVVMEEEDEEKMKCEEMAVGKVKGNLTLRQRRKWRKRRRSRETDGERMKGNRG